VITVPDAEVHIWWLSLESSEEPEVERAELLLCAEERARAGRYHFARALFLRLHAMRIDVIAELAKVAGVEAIDAIAMAS